jgi:hypothetical protein
VLTDPAFPKECKTHLYFLASAFTADTFAIHPEGQIRSVQRIKRPHLSAVNF